MHSYVYGLLSKYRTTELSQNPLWVLLNLVTCTYIFHVYLTTHSHQTQLLYVVTNMSICLLSKACLWYSTIVQKYGTAEYLQNPLWVVLILLSFGKHNYFLNLCHYGMRRVWHSRIYCCNAVMPSVNNNKFLVFHVIPSPL